MNKKILFLSLIVLCSLSSAQAVWPNPMALIGQFSQKYAALTAKCTKQNMALAAVCVGLGYWGFTKLRDWRIERAKKALISRAKQNAQQLRTERYVVDASTQKIWGKPLGISRVEITKQEDQFNVVVFEGSPKSSYGSIC